MGRVRAPGRPLARWLGPRIHPPAPCGRAAVWPDRGCRRLRVRAGRRLLARRRGVAAGRPAASAGSSTAAANSAELCPELPARAATLDECAPAKSSRRDSPSAVLISALPDSHMYGRGCLPSAQAERELDRPVVAGRTLPSQFAQQGLPRRFTPTPRRSPGKWSAPPAGGNVVRSSSTARRNGVPAGEYRHSKALVSKPRNAERWRRFIRREEKIHREDR